MEKNFNSKVFLFLFILQIECILALRLTQLHVPRSVHRGESLWLNCSYDLESDTIYSIKWYKNDIEFYRYLPSEEPAIQKYQSSGICIDLTKSAFGNVYLTASTFQTEGRYRCEVSADAPSFQTVSKEKHLKVYYLPGSGPLIVESNSDDLDIIDLTCISSPSKPASRLTWFINNKAIEAKYLLYDIISDQENAGLEIAKVRLIIPIYHFNTISSVNQLYCESKFVQTFVEQNQLTIKPNIDRDDKTTFDNFSGKSYLISQIKSFNTSIEPTADGNLEIDGYRHQYSINDFFNLTCRTKKSRYHSTLPSLKWLINDDEATTDMVEFLPDEDFGNFMLRLGVSLNQRFFDIWSIVDDKNVPRIIFKCVATYEEILSKFSKEYNIERFGRESRSESAAVNQNNQGTMNKGIKVDNNGLIISFALINFLSKILL